MAADGQMLRNGKIIPEGYFQRVARVMGKVVSAKGLHKTDRFSKSDPYCVIKGIRSNNHLANIFVTRARMDTLMPEWDEEFDFVIPRSWGLVELVGLKAMVFDSDETFVSFVGSDDFLGGADVDVSTAVTGRVIRHDLELGGLPLSKARNKKPRLCLEVTVYREVLPKPATLAHQLLTSLRTMSYTRELVGTLCKAKGLQNTDIVGLSDPQCIIRVIMMSGEVREIHRSKIMQDTLEPEWWEEFHVKFDVLNQPILIAFDVFDSDGPESCERGDHLGSAVFPLRDCEQPAPRQKKLLLLPLSQRHETRLTFDGKVDVLSRMTARLTRKTVAAPSEIGDSPATPSGRKSTRVSLTDSQLAESAQGQNSPGRFSRMALSFKNSLTAAGSESKRPILTVHLRTRSKEEEMPHIDLVDQPISVADEKDCELCLASESWARSMFQPPEQITCKQRPPRGQLKGLDRVVFVYGVMYGASGLIGKDTSRKTDAYCIVEGVSRIGEKVFIHRTRHIKSTTSPQWAEMFYMAIPEEIEISRLIFNIFDHNEKLVRAFSSAEPSDFLGRASVDISYLTAGDLVQEDIPVVGAPTQPQKTTSGFRPNSSILVEVHVERRVMPDFGLAFSDNSQVIPKRTHTVSRQPVPSRVFLDPTQEDRPVETCEFVASDVQWLASTGQLLAQRRQKTTSGFRLNWLQFPGQLHGDDDDEDEPGKPPVPPPKDAGKQDDSDEEAAAAKPLGPGCDFNRRDAVHRAASLPALHTRFARGGAPEKLPGSSPLHPQFSAASHKGVMGALSAMWRKPGPGDVSRRSRSKEDKKSLKSVTSTLHSTFPSFARDFA
ncbi:unnamed protein product [Polarella glacialis]|uniref:C2 domain-containing protein n=1 Tax=Polarella glacialis TaxID=89957 RepID=A0A813DTP5_POLGL|nr:unnamed protein product [Polarella glacialis]